MQSHKINNNHTRAQKQKKHACDKDIVSAVIITNSSCPGALTIL